MKSKARELEEHTGMTLKLILQEAFESLGSATWVAEYLGVSRRTLSTWLKQEGLTLKTIVLDKESKS